MNFARILTTLVTAGVLLTACEKSSQADTSAAEPASKAPAASADQTPAASADQTPAQQPASANVFFVNGTPITQEQFAVFYREKHKGAPPAGQPSEEEQAAVVNELVTYTVLSQEAERKQLDQSKDFQGMLDVLRIKLLAQAALADYLAANPITDEDVQKLYDEKFGGPQGMEYKARHILVATEDEAKALIVELDNGADFETLAKEKSTGPSGPNGGDLGWFGPKQMVKPFADAVVAMEKGTYSKTPVESKFGWHVILLEDSREGSPPPLDDVKMGLQGKLQQDRVNEYISSLRSKASISFPAAALPGAAEAK